MSDQLGTEGLPMFEQPVEPWLDGHVHAMVRASDPATSKNAAALVLCSVVWQRAEIVRALQYAWQNGFTAPQIADFLNRDTLPAGWVWDQEKVSRRIPEVRLAGDCVTFDGKERKGVRTMVRADREGCAIHVFARGGEPVGEPPEATNARQRRQAQGIVA